MKRSCGGTLAAAVKVKQSLIELKAEDVERVRKWVVGPSPLGRAMGFMKSAFYQAAEGRADPAATLCISAAVLAGFGYKQNPQLASRIIETARRIVRQALEAKTGMDALYDPDFDSKGTAWGLFGGVSPAVMAYLSMARGRRSCGTPMSSMGFLSILGMSPEESRLTLLRTGYQLELALAKKRGDKAAVKHFRNMISEVDERFAELAREEKKEERRFEHPWTGEPYSGPV